MNALIYFVSSVISTFFFDNIAYFLIRALARNGNDKKISNIVISIANIGYMLIDVYFMVKYFVYAFQTEEYRSYYLSYGFGELGSILGRLFVYLAFMSIINGSLILFKSKRLKNFQRSYDGKKPSVIPGISLILLAVIMATSGVLYFILPEKITVGDLIIIISLWVLSLVSLFFGIYSLVHIISHKTSSIDTKARIMFLVYLPDVTRCFISFEKTTFEEGLTPDFFQNYIIDDYGVLITKDIKYVVKGIQTPSFDERYITSSKLTEVNPIEFGNSLEQFDKYKRLKITLDDNKNTVKIVEM